jgi:hypothetical protein
MHDFSRASSAMPCEISAGLEEARPCLLPASMDFFALPTLTGRVLFVLVLPAHDRRRGVRLIAIAKHPTAMWAAQQIIEPTQAAGCGAARRTTSSHRLLRPVSSCTPPGSRVPFRARARTGRRGQARSRRDRNPQRSQDSDALHRASNNSPSRGIVAVFRVGIKIRARTTEGWSAERLACPDARPMV